MVINAHIQTVNENLQLNIPADPQEAILFIEVAQEALGEINVLLERMDQIVVQGSDKAYTRVQRNRINEKVRAVQEEIDFIIRNTTFKGVSVFGDTKDVLIDPFIVRRIIK